MLDKSPTDALPPDESKILYEEALQEILPSLPSHAADSSKKQEQDQPSEEWEGLTAKSWMERSEKEDLGIWYERDGSDFMFRSFSGPPPRSFPVTKKYVDSGILDKELNEWIRSGPRIRHGWRYCVRCKRCYDMMEEGAPANGPELGSDGCIHPYFCRNKARRGN